MTPENVAGLTITAAEINAILFPEHRGTLELLRPRQAPSIAVLDGRPAAA